MREKQPGLVMENGPVQAFDSLKAPAPVWETPPILVKRFERSSNMWTIHDVDRWENLLGGLQEG
jgi:hypothetical protein